MDEMVKTQIVIDEEYEMVILKMRDINKKAFTVVLDEVDTKWLVKELQSAWDEINKNKQK